MISIAEGKTKIIIEDPRNRKEVRIKSKSDITAGDGMSRHSLSGKNVLATETTCNCFSLLNQRGVPTHFIRQVSADTFVAKRVRMIPIEMVVRRIAFGSYLKRNTYVKEGAVFKILPVEFFLKDDSHHDPMMIWNEQKQIFDFYDPKKPIENGFMDDLELPFEKIVYLPRSEEEINQLRKLAMETFLILEEAWAKQNVTLVDLKIECGHDMDGNLLVADVIDNDSWRIWPAGDKRQMKDKENYRNLVSKVEKPSMDDLQKIKDDYAWVSQKTKLFL